MEKYGIVYCGHNIFYVNIAICLLLLLLCAKPENELYKIERNI
uniref:Uncharacterized protein n=1 Tax=viral metagenome TaxID=1070528 RepID=A0A6C0HHD9_9ZZZZ